MTTGRGSWSRATTCWRALALALALACAAGFASRAHANLVMNGSFTTTSLSSPGGFLCGVVSSSCTSTVTDWGSTCSSIGICGNSNTPGSLLFPNTNGSAWNGGIGLWSMSNSPGGGNIVAIDGDPTYSSTIFQTINGLNPGTNYLLQFYQAAAQQYDDTGSTTEQWQVSLGAETLDSSQINNPSGGFTGWFPQSMVFTATSSSETLTFLALGTPSGLPPVVLLSDVSLSAPEPASVALLGGGVLALWAARKRSKRLSARS